MLNKLVAEVWRRRKPGLRPGAVAANNATQQLLRAVQLVGQGELTAAHAICVALLASDPGLADASNVLGVIALRRREFALAVEHFSEAVALVPDNAEFCNNYGSALAGQWRTEEAIAAFRRALELEPRHPRAHPNLLWLMTMRPEFSAEERYLEHCRWAEACAEGFRIPERDFENGRDPVRVLRIGYVSSDFRTHAVGHFIEPILAHHDRRNVVPVCYSNSRAEDAATERMRAHAAEWRDIAALSDDEADALVRQDRIDILIDLSGHTRGNRLLVFARRPAPVQVTFLGYQATTGMSAIDYRLTDALADPPGAERYYRERLYRLPCNLWCYLPRFKTPDVNPLPALRTGQVRFCSMNGEARFNAAVIGAWSRVLIRVPAARMFLGAVPHGEFEKRIRDEFARHGIGEARLEIADRVELPEYYKLFAGVDIALDAFPCNGATTTCDSLWMGVPVVSLAGDEFRSRAGLSLLTAAGLPHLIARSADEYVDIAAALASDVPALAELRAGLRERLRVSPLADIGAYVAALEEAYRGMWRNWCHA